MGMLQAWAKAVQAGRLSKGDRLVPVDHSKITYQPFRRNFYIEVPELARMSEKEVADYRKQLEDVRVSPHTILFFDESHGHDLICQCCDVWATLSRSAPCSLDFPFLTNFSVLSMILVVCHSVCVMH